MTKQRRSTMRVQRGRVNVDRRPTQTSTATTNGIPATVQPAEKLAAIKAEHRKRKENR